MKNKILLAFVVIVFVSVSLLCLNGCIVSDKQYTVTFDLNGGEGELSSRTYSAGATLSDLPVPTRSGYVFKGWQDEDGKAYTAQSKMPSKNIKLVAQWEEEQVSETKYNVNFDGNGMPTVPETQSYVAGATLSELPYAERDGFAFMGWKASDGTTYDRRSVMPESDITLIAQWRQSNIEYEVEDGEATVIGYSGGAEVVIPEIIDGYAVTKIGNQTFEHNTDITSVVIGNRIEWIGSYALAGESLRSVNIPVGVTGMSNTAFAFCSNLQSITVDPSNQTYFAKDNCLIERSTKTLVVGGNQSVIPTDGSVVAIGEYAFSYRNIGNITVPGSVETIGYEAFSNCPSLQKVVLEKGVREIKASAFKKSSIREIEIPDSVTEIGEDVFYQCAELAELSIPDSVVRLGESVCYMCSSLNTLALGKQIRDIGANAFEGCALTSVVIPDSVLSVGSGAFEDCADLTEVVIGSGVTWMGNFAFYGDTKISSVNIPVNVSGIGSRVFDKNIKITCEAGQKPAGWDTAWNQSGSDVTWGTSDVQSGDYSYVVRDGGAYLTKYNGTDTVINIPSQIDGFPVVSIGSIFAKNSTITDVTVPDSVTVIGGHAFYNCASLKSVKIGKNVTDIYDFAFRDCVSLTDVDLGENLVRINLGAFMDCTSLASVTIPSKVRFVETDAFDGCSALKSMTFTETEGWHFYLKDVRHDIDVTDTAKNAKNFSNPGKLIGTWWVLSSMVAGLSR